MKEKKETKTPRDWSVAKNYSSAFLYTALFCILVLVINRIFGDGHRYVDVSLHPFWIIIIFISVQFGMVPGIISALTSILFLYVGNIPPQHLTENIFEYQYRLAFLPGLWLLTAFILGGLSSRMASRVDLLKQKLRDTERQADLIASSYEKVKTAKEYQDIKVAGDTYSVESTFKTFKILLSLKPGRILVDMNAIIQTALDPKKFSIYAAGPEGFEAATAHGWTPDDNYLRRIPVDHPLYRELAEKRRSLCVLDQDDERILDHQGVVAAPLEDPDTGDLLGMVKIEDIDFSDFNDSLLRSFKTICELVGIAYVNAKKYKAMEDKVKKYEKA